MSIDYQKLRIEGVYRQNPAGQLMQRIKLPGGLLSTAQARAVSRLAAAYGSKTLHLTTRGSLELHDLAYGDLVPVQQGLAAVGLFSRGACGGAVRGVSCSTSFGAGYEKTQVLARRLMNYFSGNPHFEGLPKKFKIAVEAGYRGSRHLIQDLSLVYVGEDDGEVFYDVWLAGGLGREPQAAFLYRQRVAEGYVLPLAEAVIRLYRSAGEPGRRLKHLLNQIGEEELRARLAEPLAAAGVLSCADAFSKAVLPVPADAAGLTLTVPVFAGQLPAGQLQLLAELTERAGLAYLLVTPDQDIALLAPDPEVREQLLRALREHDFAGVDRPAISLRICPGSHECSMGLAATRDLGQALMERLGNRLAQATVAISGCPNSCAQPQLADFGIIAGKKVKNAEGEREPRYDLYRREAEGLGQKIAEQLTQAELLEALERLI